MKHDVLFVGFEPDRYDLLAAGVSSAEFRADFISTGAGALELVSLLPYDALVISFPPPDLRCPKLLELLRHPDSTCRRAAIVLMAEPGTRVEAEALVGHGANRVLGVEDPLDALEETLRRLVNVAPRYRICALTRLDVEAEVGVVKMLCQTLNVSSTGMLVRLDEDFHAGDEIGFELSIPGDARPLRGRAAVVRRANPRREGEPGVALAFTSFQQGDKTRLSTTLARYPFAVAV